MKKTHDLKSAVFASENLMAVSGPCGHVVPIEAAIEGADKYHCPVCGMRYHVAQEPPKIYPSGFVMPGKRKIVIDAQGNLPTLFSAIDKAGCYDTPLNKM